MQYALNSEEIKYDKTVLASLPRRLIVTLSTKCNVRCMMCEVKNAGWEMPGHVIEEIISLFPHLESIAWQGGEVFFMPQFEHVFDAAAVYKNLQQTIVTNGLLLTERWAEKLSRAGSVELAISIDGVTKEVYEKIRCGSDFTVLLNNLKMLNVVRKRNKSLLRLLMHGVVMKSNYEQIGQFADFAREYGFDALHLMPIQGNMGSGENIFHCVDDAPRQRLREELTIVQAKAQKHNIEFLNSTPITVNNEKPLIRSEKSENSSSGEQGQMLCYLPWQQLNIDPGGEVRPGCQCHRSIGSVLVNTLVELWNGESMQRYREEIIGKKHGWCNEECLNGAIPAELRKI